MVEIRSHFIKHVIHKLRGLNLPRPSTLCWCALLGMAGELKCFFFSEFDPVAGPKISCQVLS